MCLCIFIKCIIYLNLKIKKNFKKYLLLILYKNIFFYDYEENKFNVKSKKNRIVLVLKYMIKKVVYFFL